MSANGIGGSSSTNALYQQMLRKTQAQQAQNTGRAGQAGGEYDQDLYLQQLNDRLDANVIAGQWNGRDEFGSKNGSTVMIHPDFLRVMHDDPATGAKYEAEINAYAKHDAEARKDLSAQGYTIDSSGMYINEKGEPSSYMAVSKPHTGGGDSPEVTKVTKKKEKSWKEEMEEMLKRIEEKKDKEKLEEQRRVEKEAAQAVAEVSSVVDTVA
jgi:hypothetical protein